MRTAEDYVQHVLGHLESHEGLFRLHHVDAGDLQRGLGIYACQQPEDPDLNGGLWYELRCHGCCVGMVAACHNSDLPLRLTNGLTLPSAMTLEFAHLWLGHLRATPFTTERTERVR